MEKRGTVTVDLDYFNSLESFKNAVMSKETIIIWISSTMKYWVYSPDDEVKSIATTNLALMERIKFLEEELSVLKYQTYTQSVWDFLKNKRKWQREVTQ